MCILLELPGSLEVNIEISTSNRMPLGAINDKFGEW